MQDALRDAVHCTNTHTSALLSQSRKQLFRRKSAEAEKNLANFEGKLSKAIEYTKLSTYGSRLSDELDNQHTFQRMEEDVLHANCPARLIVLRGMKTFIWWTMVWWGPRISAMNGQGDWESQISHLVHAPSHGEM